MKLSVALGLLLAVTGFSFFAAVHFKSNAVKVEFPMRALAVPAGFGDCFSAPYCQGANLGHFDYAYCSQAGQSWRADADGLCY